MVQFDRENALVLLVARGTLSEKERTELEKLLGADLDWDYVLVQLKRHKLFPLLVSHWQLCRNPKNLEAILNEVKNNCTEPIKRSRMLDTELCRIAESLTEKDIIYVVLKGPILAHVIYDDPGKRTYNDIDILVKKSDTDTVSNILKEQRYVQGQFDQEKGEIVPALRENLVWCSMYIHQLYPFQKIVDQCLCKIEVQTKFYSQYENQNIYGIDVSKTQELWQSLSVIAVNDEQIYTLNWNYFLLQLCLHAYIDEVSVTRMVYETGIRLRAYCDIRELIISKKQEINSNKFTEIVQKSEANKPVYYILNNLSKIYNDVWDFVSPILNKISPKTLDFIDEFGHPWETLDKQRGRFSKPFTERLFDNSCKKDYEDQKHLFRDPNWMNLY